MNSVLWTAFIFAGALLFGRRHLKEEWEDATVRAIFTASLSLLLKLLLFPGV